MHDHDHNLMTFGDAFWGATQLIILFGWIAFLSAAVGITVFIIFKHAYQWLQERYDLDID